MIVSQLVKVIADRTDRKTLEIAHGLIHEVIEHVLDRATHRPHVGSRYEGSQLDEGIDNTAGIAPHDAAKGVEQLFAGEGLDFTHHAKVIEYKAAIGLDGEVAGMGIGMKKAMAQHLHQIGFGP